MRPRPVLVGLLSALLIAGCGGSADLDVVTADVTERETPRLTDRKDIDRVADASTAFALDLFQRVAADQKLKGENLVLGPFSTWLALTMLSVGANGKTAEELAEVLHHPFPEDRLLTAINALEGTIKHRTDDEDTVLRINAQVFGAPGGPFVPAFLDAMAGQFGAPLATVDFTDTERARKRINAWVKRQTEGKIPELLKKDVLTSDIKVVLVNAMYLDAPWEFTIDPTMTSPGAFTKADGSTVQVPFMYYDDHLPSAIGEGYAAVEMPYEGGGLSMVIVVPQPTAKVAGNRMLTTPAPSLDRLVENLDAASLERMLSEIKDNGIHLSLPRFAFPTHRKMLDDLKALGAPTAVDNGDYNRLLQGGMGLRFVEHEAFVQVDEYGTKAAAATAVGGGMSHGPTITADRPFLFLVRERATNTVLFLGRVMDPSVS